jgi:hypothetical protein
MRAYSAIGRRERIASWLRSVINLADGLRPISALRYAPW